MPQTDPVINAPANLQGGAHALKRLAGHALNTLLPPQCPSCNALVEEPGTLCGECWKRVDFLTPPMCSACGLPFEFEVEGEEDVLCGACVRHRPPFARARAVMIYGDFSRKLVLAFKHGDRTDTAPGLGRWMARAGRDLTGDADVIAPVPLHWTRLFQRRYNQAALLAAVLGRETGVAVVQDLLIRKRKTVPQGRLGPAERRRNLRGAFRINAKRRLEMQGKRVLLVDDVLTTGATATATAKVLLKAGAGAVDVLTLARVVRAA